MQPMVDPSLAVRASEAVELYSYLLKQVTEGDKVAAATLVLAAVNARGLDRLWED